MWIILGAVVVLLLIAIFSFNGLVKRRNRTAEAWSQIDVELKRRHDLVPNLVETVKGYAAHERQTYEAVTEGTRPGSECGCDGGIPNRLPRPRTR